MIISSLTSNFSHPKSLHKILFTLLFQNRRFGLNFLAKAFQLSENFFNEECQRLPLLYVEVQHIISKKETSDVNLTFTA